MSRRVAGAILALDVDGVLIDQYRGGAGPWTVELERRFAVQPADLRAFFQGPWADVVLGHVPLEVALRPVVE